MKKSLLTIIPVLFLAFCLTGCKPDDPQTAPPALSPETEEPLSIPAEGGECSIAYKLENPVAGGSVTADCGDTEWISDIDCATAGTVSFNVLPNEAVESRNAEMTVTYTYPDGELSFTVGLLIRR